MKKVGILSVCILVACILIGSCSPMMRTVEVTRVVPQTVIVTPNGLTIDQAPSTSLTPVPFHKITQEVLTATATRDIVEIESKTPTATSKSTLLSNLPNSFTPVPTDTPGPTPFIDMASQDPEIVIVQYYTLLDLRLYQDAYQFLSQNAQSNQPFGDFTWGMEQSYKVIRVLKVVRFNDWIKQNHSNAALAKDNVYYVKLYVRGYDLANLVPVNGNVDSYVWVVRENGEVKLEFHALQPYD